MSHLRTCLPLRPLRYFLPLFSPTTTTTTTPIIPLPLTRSMTKKAYKRIFRSANVAIQSFYTGPSQPFLIPPRFTSTNNPPLSWWNDAPNLFTHQGADAGPLGSPAILHAVTARYVAFSLSPEGHSVLPNDISPHVLHSAMLVIITGPQGSAMHIAMHALLRLTVANYVPSLLTLARLGLRAKKPDHGSFKMAMERFSTMRDQCRESLARESQESKEDKEEQERMRYAPDIFTLQGIISSQAETKQSDKAALVWFRRAEEAASNIADVAQLREGWQWRGSCTLIKGKLHMRLGQREEARESFRVAAEELDLAEGAWLYGQFLGSEEEKERREERTKWVRKAAVSGIVEAIREMGRLEQAGTGTGTGRWEGNWERKAVDVLREEWKGVAEVGG